MPMLSDDRYKSTIAFIDLLFNILVGFVFLFLVAFLLINPVAKKDDIKAKAEFMITMEWPDPDINDMDLWMQDPLGNRVGFRNKEAGLMNLDRDDLGKSNDTVTVNGEEVSVEGNKETVSIRGIVPGEYLVSGHLYRVNEDLPKPIPVRVEVIKINPYKIIYQQTIAFGGRGEAHNYYSFTVDANGFVSAVSETDRSAIPLETLP
jgi:hypothetical protein